MPLPRPISDTPKDVFEDIKRHPDRHPQLWSMYGRDYGPVGSHKKLSLRGQWTDEEEEAFIKFVKIRKTQNPNISTYEIKFWRKDNTHEALNIDNVAQRTSVAYKAKWFRLVDERGLESEKKKEVDDKVKDQAGCDKHYFCICENLTSDDQVSNHIDKIQDEDIDIEPLNSSSSSMSSCDMEELKATKMRVAYKYKSDSDTESDSDTQTSETPQIPRFSSLKEIILNDLSVIEESSEDDSHKGEFWMDVIDDPPTENKEGTQNQVEEKDKEEEMSHKESSEDDSHEGELWMDVIDDPPTENKEGTQNQVEEKDKEEQMSHKESSEDESHEGELCMDMIDDPLKIDNDPTEIDNDPLKIDNEEVRGETEDQSFGFYNEN